MNWLKYLLIGVVSVTLISILGVAVGLSFFSKNLPSVDELKSYQPLVVTTVYTDDDKVMAEFSTERRITLPPGEAPKVLVNAFVAAEDDEFFSHRGINPATIIRAAFKDLLVGHAAQGGSTITQQVAKSIFLSREKTLSRKIREALLAFKIEKVLTKQEIIYLYMNQINLGNGAYGVESAAQVYFGKHAHDLTLAEAAILAGLPRAPSRDNPVANPTFSKNRQRYVLGRMLSIGVISRSQYDEAMRSPVQIKSKAKMLDSPAPYFSEHVRRYLMKKYGQDAVYGGGLKVYTTMNMTAQLAAQDAIKTGLLSLDKRAGMRKPGRTLKTTAERDAFLEQQHKELLSQFYDYRILTTDGKLVSPAEVGDSSPIEMGKSYPAVVLEKDRRTKLITVGVGNRRGTIAPADYRWAQYANPEEIYTERVIRDPLTQLTVGDVIYIHPKVIRTVKGSRDEYVLEQQPLVQGALVSYAVPDGALKALVGGYDYRITKSEFNRALQAVRQPGSSFKPIVYAAALDAGLTPSTIIVDSPIVYRNEDEQTHVEKTWKPDNSTDKFYGDTTLRNALAFSRNIPTIKLLQHIKVPTVIDYAKKLGIRTPLAPDLSIALGSSGVILEELVRAESTFDNHGKRLNGYFIRRVEDRNGKVLEEHKTEDSPQLIPDSTAFLMTSMMRSVVDIGTGAVVKELGRPVAGKTGTTNDFKDAWFMGFIPQMFTGVWVGFDEDRTLGRNETGAQAAAPIWLHYMKVAAKDIPVQDFQVPESVVQVQVDADTGDVPSAQTKRRYTEYYANGTAPGQTPPPPATGGAPAAPTVATVNRTKVITGNPDRPGTAGATSTPEDSSVGTDELFRNEN